MAVRKDITLLDLYRKDKKKFDVNKVLNKYNEWIEHFNPRRQEKSLFKTDWHCHRSKWWVVHRKGWWTNYDYGQLYRQYWGLRLQKKLLNKRSCLG